MLAIAGSAPDWTVGGFGAAALDFGYLMVGGEIVQQPKELEGLPGSDMPASVSVFARVVPVRNRLSVDVALVRFAGTISPGLDIRAENRLGFGTTVRF